MLVGTMNTVPLHSMRKGFLFYFFSLGFRPFFLLSGLYAGLALAIWLFLYMEGLAPDSLWADTAVWHGHEMIFGYTAGVIGGFLLTAVPNWTKARPVRAWPLACLVALWLAGRGAMLLIGHWPFLAVLLDGAFLPALAISLFPAVMKAQSYRNLVFFLILSALSLCNVLIHMMMSWDMEFLLDARTLLYTAIHLVALMIIVFGGRVVPMFTRNALKVKRVELTMAVPDALELTTLMYSTLAVPAVLFMTVLPMETGVILAMCGILNLARLGFWHGGKTFRMPIVWVLHAGYFWLSLGILLEGIALMVRPDLYSLALHTLTMGGIGTMTLAMMTRVSLGHTGRPLAVSKAVTFSYLLLQAGIALRVAGGLFLPEDYMLTVIVSGICWITSFTIFSIIYLPILFRPRADETPLV